MKKLALLLALLIAAPLVAATTANDDSCDITTAPAATLLLPYFEVDFRSPQSTAVTTLFTIQNTSKFPQIANVTLWTDRAYPALNFSIFLTGYDVQSINLYDVFARAVIAPGGALPSGTSSNTTVPANPTPGSQAGPNNSNPNFASNISNCANLPGSFPQTLLTDVQAIFTTGAPGAQPLACIPPPGLPLVFGNQHDHAIGYITIDVMANCLALRPTSATYFANVLFDNTLTGDYQVVVPRASQSYAQGGPLVHIRAIPEGGAAGAGPGTPLPYTFYDHYTSGAQKSIDRRQPLPSLFAPRYIQGGQGGFNTKLKIWREGLTTSDSTCTAYSSNAALPVTDVVRFDEHENATVMIPPALQDPPQPTTTAVTQQLPTTGALFPPLTTSGDVAGWIYLNLNNGGSATRASQAWVITSMFAEPTYAVEATALALGNGCSPAKAANAQIGPVP